MFEYLDFTDMPGRNCQKELKLLTLVTCGYCKRAKKFLKENELKYSYIDVDSLGKEVRQQVRKDFVDVHKRILSYPTLLIEEEDALVGFTRSTWVSTLLGKEE